MGKKFMGHEYFCKALKVFIPKNPTFAIQYKKHKIAKTTIKMKSLKINDWDGSHSNKHKTCKCQMEKVPFNTFLVSFKTETETVQGETKRGKKGKHVCMCKEASTMLWLSI
ncbi:hypothetical protein ILYODFUR_016909 [Ilyodon furcidens]|uniref:Uncharacterized protein n=1 Tax=Ilyodon furcidens TaxID=33524 RepID=A0ABV0TJA4_9TELE